MDKVFANIYEVEARNNDSCFTCDGSCHCECDGSGEACNWG